MKSFFEYRRDEIKKDFGTPAERERRGPISASSTYESHLDSFNSLWNRWSYYERKCWLSGNISIHQRTAAIEMRILLEKILGEECGIDSIRFYFVR